MTKLPGILLFVLSLFLLASCTSNVDITPNKTQNHKYLGKGVWATIPSGYFKAENYDGYQYPGYKSSISVEVEDISFDKQKENFDRGRLRRAKMKLIESANVMYGEKDSAYYVLIHNPRKKKFQHILSIKDGNRVKNIIGFCFTPVGKEFNPKIKKSLFSIFLEDEIPVTESEFIMADILTLGSFIYTKDGKNPTESPDEAMITTGSYEPRGRAEAITEVTTLLGEATETEDSEIDVTEEKLENASFFHATSEGNDRFAYAAIVHDGSEGIYLLCHGNSRGNIDECRKYFMTTYMSYELKY